VRERDGAVTVERVRVQSQWGRGPVQAFMLARVAFRYLRRVRRRRPDILHAVDLPMLAVAIAIAPLAGRPRIVYEAFEVYSVMVSHRMPRPVLWVIERLEQWLPRHAELVITPGQIRQDYFARLGIDSTRVPNWIDPPGEATSRADARAAFGLDGDSTVIVYAGALHGSRDIDVLLGHAERFPDHAVLIAGRGDDEARLRARAASLPNVRMLGWLADPEPLLAAADMTYYSLRPDHPYAALAAPNTLYQAIAHAVPLVHRPQGELAWVGARHRVGMAFDDDAGLDAAIDRLADPVLNARVRDELRRLQATYRWELAEQALLDAYPRPGASVPASAAGHGQADGPGS
jgi:glycosyltransferase involved in cell wall biosynthesis